MTRIVGEHNELNGYRGGLTGGYSEYRSSFQGSASLL
jgi:hypothetical protein